MLNKLTVIITADKKVYILFDEYCIHQCRVTTQDTALVGSNKVGDSYYVDIIWVFRVKN